MKVKCIRNTRKTGWGLKCATDYLTVGKIYDVLDVCSINDHIFYFVENDWGGHSYLEKKWFRALYEIRCRKLEELGI